MKEDSEDIEFVDEDGEANPRDTIKRLRAELKNAQKDKQEYLELSQRLKADMVNAKRQDDEWRKEFVKFSEEKLVMRLLTAVDAFNMAMANKSQWEALPKDWRIGMEYVYKELISALSEHGLQEISPRAGAPFDPKEHSSIDSVETKEKELDHTVAEVVQKGYGLSGKILKPAIVKIAEFKE